MPWINIDGSQQETRPVRIRLVDGFTRTNEEVTDELLAEYGWSWQDPPLPDVSWDPNTVTNVTYELNSDN